MCTHELCLHIRLAEHFGALCCVRLHATALCAAACAGAFVCGHRGGHDAPSLRSTRAGLATAGCVRQWVVKQAVTKLPAIRKTIKSSAAADQRQRWWPATTAPMNSTAHTRRITAPCIPATSTMPDNHPRKPPHNAHTAVRQHEMRSHCSGCMAISMLLLLYRQECRCDPPPQDSWRINTPCMLTSGERLCTTKHAGARCPPAEARLQNIHTSGMAGTEHTHALHRRPGWARASLLLLDALARHAAMKCGHDNCCTHASVRVLSAAHPRQGTYACKEQQRN